MPYKRGDSYIFRENDAGNRKRAQLSAVEPSKKGSPILPMVEVALHPLPLLGTGAVLSEDVMANPGVRPSMVAHKWCVYGKSSEKLGPDTPKSPCTLPILPKKNRECGAECAVDAIDSA
jgi:hypothetical protein